MIFKIEGKISYNGPSDPPGEYYGIDLPDGKHINIGFNATVWGGDIYHGIPELRSPSIKNHKCRITIEIIDADEEGCKGCSDNSTEEVVNDFSGCAPGWISENLQAGRIYCDYFNGWIMPINKRLPSCRKLK